MLSSHNIRTLFLIVLLTGILMAIGGLLGGLSGLVTALVIAFAMNFFVYWFSDSLALRMAHAKPVSEQEQPRLHQMVERLAQRAHIPKPKVYLIDNDSPNAFATGRSPSHAAVACTSGILRLMSEKELEGVLAHELAHVKNRDTLTMSVVATVAGAITFIANMLTWGMMFGGFGGRNSGGKGSAAGLGLVIALLVGILAPIAAMLVQLAISRSREFQADASGARINGDPYPLADALQKLETAVQRKPMEVNQATAHLYIVNPLSGKSMSRLFSTHPPVEERVRRLRGMRMSL
ncbi:MAG: protease HtpX [Dehalococcoidia bacterium]|nr:protease HtpX [Dehalococcoidia bacterium]